MFSEEADDFVLPISVVKFNKSEHNFDKGWLNGSTAYIGRGSPLGNKWTTKDSKYSGTVRVATKELAIKHFEQNLYMRGLDQEAYDALKVLHKLSKKQSITLVCFCKPDCCHGDVIRKYLEELC